MKIIVNTALFLGISIFCLIVFSVNSQALQCSVTGQTSTDIYGLCKKGTCREFFVVTGIYRKGNVCHMSPVVKSLDEQFGQSWGMVFHALWDNQDIISKPGVYKFNLHISEHSQFTDPVPRNTYRYFVNTTFGNNYVFDISGSWVGETEKWSEIRSSFVKQEKSSDRMEALLFLVSPLILAPMLMLGFIWAYIRSSRISSSVVKFISRFTIVILIIGLLALSFFINGMAMMASYGSDTFWGTYWWAPGATLLAVMAYFLLRAIIRKLGVLQ